MSRLCNINMGSVCIRSRQRFFLVSFQMLYSKIMLSAVMLIGSSVFSVGSVVFPARSLIRDRWVFCTG